MPLAGLLSSLGAEVMSAATFTEASSGVLSSLVGLIGHVLGLRTQDMRLVRLGLLLPAADRRSSSSLSLEA